MDAYIPESPGSSINGSKTNTQTTRHTTNKHGEARQRPANPDRQAGTAPPYLPGVREAQPQQLAAELEGGDAEGQQPQGDEGQVGEHAC